MHSSTRGSLTRRLEVSSLFATARGKACDCRSQSRSPTSSGGRGQFLAMAYRSPSNMAERKQNASSLIMRCMISPYLAEARHITLNLGLNLAGARIAIAFAGVLPRPRRWASAEACKTWPAPFVKFVSG